MAGRGGTTPKTRQPAAATAAYRTGPRTPAAYSGAHVAASGTPPMDDADSDSPAATAVRRLVARVSVAQLKSLLTRAGVRHDRFIEKSELRAAVVGAVHEGRLDADTVEQYTVASHGPFQAASPPKPQSEPAPTFASVFGAAAATQRTAKSSSHRSGSGHARRSGPVKASVPKASIGATTREAAAAAAAAAPVPASAPAPGQGAGSAPAAAPGPAKSTTSPTRRSKQDAHHHRRDATQPQQRQRPQPQSQAQSQSQSQSPPQAQRRRRNSGNSVSSDTATESWLEARAPDGAIYYYHKYDSIALGVCVCVYYVSHQ